MDEKNTLFETMWNQELLGNYERESGDDEKPRARSVADAIADIHRATLDALIEVSRPPQPPQASVEPPSFIPPYAYPPYARRRHPRDFVDALGFVDPQLFDPHTCVHHNCPICRKAAEMDANALDAADMPPRRPRRCSVCGSVKTPRSGGLFYGEGPGMMCRTCAAAQGDAPPTRQPAPPLAADAHANDGVLADEHDSMLDEPEVAEPGLGSFDEHASLDEQAVGDRPSGRPRKPSQVPVPDLSRDLDLKR